MGYLIPRDLRTNRLSTAVWLASKHRDRLRQAAIDVPDIPQNAIVYYAYFQKNLTLARRDLVSGADMYTTRASDANILQSSGSVQTFDKGEPAFVVGEWMLVEGEATNIVPWSNDMGGGNWNAGSSIVASGALQLQGVDFSSVETTITGNIFINTAVQYTIGAYAVQFKLAKSVTPFTITSFGSGGGSGAISLNAMTGVIAGGFGTVEDKGGYWLVKYKINRTVAGAGLIYLQIGNHAAGDTFYVGDMQVELGDNSTSVVRTSGLPATRAPANEQVTTFTDKTYLLDDPATATVPCVLSSTVGGFTDGIALGSGAMTFGLAANVTGKYRLQLAPYWLGATLTASNGVVLKVATVFSADTFTYTLLSNPTALSDDDAIHAGFSNDGTSSNRFTIDFSTSDYGLPSNWAAAKLLRQGVGDSAFVASVGEPVQWATDVRIGYPALNLNNAVAGMVLGQSGDASIYWDGSNIVADINATTATIAVADPTAISSAYLEYDGVNLYVRVDGVQSAGVASAAPVLAQTWQIGCDDLIANHAAGGYHDLLVQPFASSPP